MRDIISDLPDPILLRILSSESPYIKHVIDTKQVIATSLLSRRWRSLWLSIPKLHFDKNYGFHSLESFIQFVDAALLLVDLNFVKTFYLECVGPCIPSIKVNLWITALMRIKLEHLTLYVGLDQDQFELPASIFMWDTIRVIKLSGVIISNLSTVNLPSLRSLHLVYVTVSESQSLEFLLSNLFYLEELRLEILNIDSHDLDLELDIGRQDHLVCADVLNLFPPSLIPIETFYNVTSLRLREIDWFLEDDIPIFNNLIHLEVADVNFRSWSNFVTSPQNFPKLETLVTYKFEIYEDEDDDELMETALEVPPCVSSHLKVFAFRTINCKCKMVQYILKHAKVLRDIVIIPNGSEEDIEFLREFISPICPKNCRLSFNNYMYDELMPLIKFRY